MKILQTIISYDTIEKEKQYISISVYDNSGDKLIVISTEGFRSYNITNPKNVVILCNELMLLFSYSDFNFIYKNIDSMMFLLHFSKGTSDTFSTTRTLLPGDFEELLKES